MEKIDKQIENKFQPFFRLHSLLNQNRYEQMRQLSEMLKYVENGKI